MAGGYEDPTQRKLKMRYRPTEKRLRGYTILIPLNVPRVFPSDYIEQTAKILAEKNEVILFDFRNPCSVFTFFRNASKRKKILHQIATLYRSGKNGIKEFSPLGIFPFQNNEYVYRLNRYLGVWQLKLILESSRRKQIGIWGFHPLMALLLGRYRERFSLYDCVDYYGDELGVGTQLQQLEQKAFQLVTLVSFNSSALFKKKLTANPILKHKGFVVPCGCDTNLFIKALSATDVLKNIPHPRIGFVGHINHRMDFKLLRQLALKHPKWSFVLLGPIFIKQLEDSHYNVRDNIKRLKQLPNVYFLGRRTKTSLPKYMKAMDIGIVPYRTDFNSVRFCNPMKVYEYFACGKPVVATPILALKELDNDVIQLANGARDFGLAVSGFLKRWDKKKMLMAFKIAREQGWDVKITTIEEHLQEKINYDYRKTSKSRNSSSGRGH